MTTEEFDVKNNQICEVKLIFTSEREFCFRLELNAGPKLAMRKEAALNLRAQNTLEERFVWFLCRDLGLPAYFWASLTSNAHINTYLNYSATH